MSRQTKMKIAALATALVATLGVAAVSPATASALGQDHHQHAWRRRRLLLLNV